jgi:hypothetical protein
MQKTTIDASLFTPSNAKMSTLVAVQKGMRRLNGPYLSANVLGTVRPNTEAALMIDTLTDMKYS